MIARAKTRLSIAVLSALIGAAPASAPFRAAGFDTTNLPKVLAPLDIRHVRSASVSPSPADFRLVEDGRPTVSASQTLKFRDTDLGLALIVAIDASGSMKGRPMNAIRQGLAQLVSRKRDRDRIAVLSFADDLRWETRWDASQQAVENTFRNMQTRGNQTRLFDGVNEALSELATQSGKDKDFPFRQCVLLLSDGHDEGSQTKLDQLISRLRDSRVRLDSIGLARSPLWLGNMRELSEASFGQFQAVPSPPALTSVLGKGMDILLDLPVLEFTAQNLTADGNTHQIGIEQIATGTRDQISKGLGLKTLGGFAKAINPKLLWGGCALAVLLLCAGVFLVLRKGRPGPTAASSVPVTAPPPARPSPPALRATTIAEPSISGSARSRSLTDVEPSRLESSRSPIAAQEPSPAIPPAKPVRQGTLLAPQAAASASPMNLIATSGPNTGLRIPLSETEFWIGSAANNHLCLTTDPGVSGNHACIRRENQFYRLYDNDSLNNTWVNGNAVGRGVVILRSGDQISVGQSVFTFGE